MNSAWLDQAQTLLERLDSDAYASIGGHMRHILEFYECFLDGLPAGRVDYDARRRDLLVESSQSVASARIRLMRDRLYELGITAEATLLTRLDGAEACSTVARELLALSSHTVHHFAIIAISLRTHGVTPDPTFGVAPSTLEYRNRRQQQQHAA